MLSCMVAYPMRATMQLSQFRHGQRPRADGRPESSLLSCIVAPPMKATLQLVLCDEQVRMGPEIAHAPHSAHYPREISLWIVICRPSISAANLHIRTRSFGRNRDSISPQVINTHRHGICNEVIRFKGSQRFPAYSSRGTAPSCQIRRDSGSQDWSRLGLHRGRPCHLSTFSLLFPTASAASDINFGD